MDPSFHGTERVSMIEPMASRSASTRKTDYVMEGGPLGLVVCGVGGAPYGTTLEEGKPLDIGRDAELAINHDSVSRRHARIEWDGATPVVRDLESTNGTRVDGRKLAPAERVAIGVGTSLLLGRVAVLVQPVEAIRALLMGRASVAPSAALPSDIVANDPKMRQLYALVQVIAPSELPVLVLGETGSGKEVLASALHRLSTRAEHAFLAVSCASFPETLLESELFGFERGAFTGAAQPKPGLFEAANGGTLFLDEIGETTPATQAKLLRVLETGEVMRLGSVKPKVVNVRIVAATNRDLETATQDGSFRSDLYYRLAGMVLHLPPLRERPDDVEALAASFVVTFAAKANKPPPKIADKTLALLKAHTWPGNARELRNVMQRATILAGAAPSIEPEHLALTAAKSTIPPPMKSDLKGAVDQFERERIVAALAQAGGNQTKAAEILGIARRTLVAKLEAHGIDRPRKR